MDAKKISFGFSKIEKKPNLNLMPQKQQTKDESKVELIKCLEGKEIKLMEEKQKESPLVIKMKENHKTSSALLSLLKRRAVLLDEEKEETKVEGSPQIKDNDDSNISIKNSADTLEQRATRELLAAIKDSGEVEGDNKVVLPVIKADDLPLDGAKESTLDDYDNIPIQHFGFAMLRGMGWVEPPKKKRGSPIDEAPIVRPKGMGLGADKALKKKPLLVAPEPNEILQVKKNAYVRILGGKHKDFYGQIEGFDDHAGRVIVKMAIGGNKEVFNEFMCQPIARKEYNEYGKCINTTKYEEYKRMENEHGQVIIKEEKPHINKEVIKSACKSSDFNSITRERSNKDYIDERPDVKPKKEELRQLLRYEVEHHKKSIHKVHSFKDEHKKEKTDMNKLKEEPKNFVPPYENKDCKSRTYTNHSFNSNDKSVHKERSIIRCRSTERHKHNKNRHVRRASSTSSSTSSESSREHKSRKSGKKKRKSKHRKHKRSSSSDSSTSNTSSSSSSTEHKHHHRHRSHKKKTRKYKKQHGRPKTKERR